MRRIEQTFATLKAEKRAGLVTFIMGGDPDYDTSLKLLRALPEAGADIIELGMPFSDPMADGPIIQAAGNRALAAGMTLKRVLKMAEDFRKVNEKTPLILMGYYNPVYRYGPEKFARDAAQAGVDGFIIVDLPPEEEGEFLPHAQKAGLALIRLVTPTSDDKRLPLLLKNAQGFLYYVAVAGVTGGKSANHAALKQSLERIKHHTALPVAVGFGIKTPAQAKEAAASADAVVVGSALVEALAQGGGNIEPALELVRALRESVEK